MKSNLEKENRKDEEAAEENERSRKESEGDDGFVEIKSRRRNRNGEIVYPGQETRETATNQPKNKGKKSKKNKRKALKESGTATNQKGTNEAKREVKEEVKQLVKEGKKNRENVQLENQNAGKVSESCSLVSPMCFFFIFFFGLIASSFLAQMLLSLL